MGGGSESRCVGRVYRLDGAVHGTVQGVSSVPVPTGSTETSFRFAYYSINRWDE